MGGFKIRSSENQSKRIGFSVALLLSLLFCFVCFVLFYGNSGEKGEKGEC